MQIVSYYNGLGETVTSPILAMFMFKGFVQCIVLDRVGNPCLIRQDQIEGYHWQQA